ncbi:hypothetical protein chiPu_0026697 [Chiloscyllium punctatum]|uniref:Uncharacterized protein n=1 Tax=Chiloscyllium punctatum TaxID=137246 RepID=A0A401TJ29_CHIPU|nr:hypothetical protein [Chiloscyllium punctatum]
MRDITVERRLRVRPATSSGATSDETPRWRRPCARSRSVSSRLATAVTLRVHIGNSGLSSGVTDPCGRGKGPRNCGCNKLGLLIRGCEASRRWGSSDVISIRRFLLFTVSSKDVDYLCRDMALPRNDAICVSAAKPKLFWPTQFEYFLKIQCSVSQRYPVMISYFIHKY